MSQIFAHRLYRDVLCQEQAAIGMPQAVTGNVPKTVLVLKLCKEVSDAVRVYRLAVVIDDQIILFEMLVKFLIGKAKPIHIKFEVGDKRVRERNIALRLLRFRFFFVDIDAMSHWEDDL